MKKSLSEKETLTLMRASKYAARLGYAEESKRFVEYVYEKITKRWPTARAWANYKRSSRRKLSLLWKIP